MLQIKVDREEARSRAPEGGAYGANGEFYKGGQFLAQTEAPSAIKFRTRKHQAFPMGKLVTFRRPDNSVACGDCIEIPSDVRYEITPHFIPFFTGGGRTEIVETLVIRSWGEDVLCTWCDGVFISARYVNSKRMFGFDGYNVVNLREGKPAHDAGKRSYAFYQAAMMAYAAASQRRQPQGGAR